MSRYDPPFTSTPLSLSWNGVFVYRICPWLGAAGGVLKGLDIGYAEPERLNCGARQKPIANHQREVTSLPDPNPPQNSTTCHLRLRRLRSFLRSWNRYRIDHPRAPPSPEKSKKCVTKHKKYPDAPPPQALPIFLCTSDTYSPPPTVELHPTAVYDNQNAILPDPSHRFRRTGAGRNSPGAIARSIRSTPPTSKPSRPRGYSRPATMPKTSRPRPWSRTA